jgi:hypothetical protein
MSTARSTVYGGYTYRTMGQIPMDKRPDILEYYVTNGRQAMVKQFNMSNQAASHLLYYYKDMIEEIEDEHFKEAGL